MKRKQNGITLVALVITIIILLILAGISISALTGSGLFAKANDAKIASKIGEIEEFATLKVYELYTENVDNMEAVNDATIRTALKTELTTKGYKIRDVNTTSETVNGLKVQDSTGQNNFDSLSLLQQKNTTIKVGLDTASQLISSKTYVKIYDDWYELIIKDKTVKVSREKYEEPEDSENKYEIKLTPPSSGITMTVGGKPITSETPITPETLIVVQAGNSTGTFSFTVKETKSSVTRNVNVKVTADPAYATSLSIAAKGGTAEITVGGTLQLVATKTPTTSTDDVIWKIKSGSATVDTAGLVTANTDATVGSTIKVSATCNRKDGTTSIVGEQTLDITVKSAGENVGDTVNTESKIGYYADIDDDGTVDGVIYADLVESKSGQWGGSEGTYSYSSQDGLKSYYIKKANYNDGHFGDHPVIAPENGTSGDDRFYIMALSDFNGASYSWDYKAHYIFYDTWGYFGAGVRDTAILMEYWFWNFELENAGWSDEDIWVNIKDEYNNGWFVPSREELLAFAGNLDITSSNYSHFGLNEYYWSSSQFNDDPNGNTAWVANLYAGNMQGQMSSGGYDVGYYVRLSKTF